MILAGVRAQESPVAGMIDEAIETVPVNPFTGATVIVEVAEAPALAFVEVGLAETAKSCRVKVTVAVWISPPLVPVTVTVYTPAVPEQEKYEDCEAPRTTLVGFKVQDAPLL